MNRIVCGSCGRTFNTKMKFCPFCGAQKAGDAQDGNRNCPCCARNLRDVLIRREQVFMCEQCEGLWLPTPAFEKLTSLRDVLSDPSVPDRYTRPALENRGHYIPCPCCGEPMVRRNFRKMSGVIIDICGEHGVWFDKGELELLRAFIAAGGVDRSQDREIERHEHDLDMLKWKTSQLEMMERILHKWDLGRFRFRKF